MPPRRSRRYSLFLFIDTAPDPPLCAGAQEFCEMFSLPFGALLLVAAVATLWMVRPRPAGLRPRYLENSVIGSSAALFVTSALALGVALFVKGILDLAY